VQVAIHAQCMQLFSVSSPAERRTCETQSLPQSAASLLSGWGRRAESRQSLSLGNLYAGDSCHLCSFSSGTK
jgi:hypothetical protein